MALRVLLIGLAMCLGAGTATAQAAQPGFGWHGGYGGFVLGLARSGGDARRGAFAGEIISRDVGNALFPSGIDRSTTAALGGAFLGYSVQRGRYLAGIELDGTWQDLDVAARFDRIDPTPPPDPFAGVDTRSSYQTRISALGSLRARLGVARGGTLFYGTAGVAVGRVTNGWELELPDIAFPDGPFTYSNRWSERNTRFGLAIGAGIEQRLGPRTSVRAEFLHYDLGSTRIGAADPIAFPGNSIAWRFRNDVQVLRLAFAFRF